MAEILLFHHARGLTEGLCAFADRLRADGHTVYTPDAYAGRVFDNDEDGVRHAETIGHDAVAHVGMRAARKHPAADVVIGFSLGTMQAQLVAQHRRGIRGCVLMGGAMPPEHLGSAWPAHLPLQIHVADPDDWCTTDDVETLRRGAPHAEVFTYPHRGHLFVDPTLADYDADAADAFEERVADFLARIDAGRAEPARVTL
ncbi:dienelactone hydrolase family protein [Demequina sp. NBRC 110051]|uniref:dienelactone hydrolase family protein n=1 Tax=Demequina sp. NBRC 110051 TaxID=1570340 RepID=UPI0009FE6ACA|nr:dienelactone hydrolase family protein [Demequina sp. NBRC 110051]